MFNSQIECGTHWTQHICNLIVSKSNEFWNSDVSCCYYNCRPGISSIGPDFSLKKKNVRKYIWNGKIYYSAPFEIFTRLHTIEWNCDIPVKLALRYAALHISLTCVHWNRGAKYRIHLYRHQKFKRYAWICLQKFTFKWI